MRSKKKRCRRTVGHKSKKCTKCMKRKALSQFYAHPLMRDGRGSWCKECQKLYAKISHHGRAKAPIIPFPQGRVLVDNL
jgi:hypothetical protein